jgi:hypothetical protein
MRRQLPTILSTLLSCCAVSVGFSQSIIFMDDFDGNTVPDFDVTPVAGEMIPQGDNPWGVNTSGLPATWASDNNPFTEGTFYARLLDDSNTDGLGTRFQTTDDDSDPNDYGSRITGQISTFVFDFYEPADLDANDAGFGFGYSNADDLNSSERVWRAILDNGELTADNGVGTTDPIIYSEETVNRIFMVANDSAAAVSNYRGGQTLEASEADVWISLEGADPTYAFSLGMQNPGPHSAGFRSFTGDFNELWIDNVFLLEGIDFSLTLEPPERLSLLVDPDNGQVRIENNEATDITFSSYQITSEGESLNENGWNTIAGQGIAGFPTGDGTGNGWEQGPSADGGELVEWFLQGESTLGAGEAISLGAAYNTLVDAQDLEFRYSEAGSIATAKVFYGPIEPPVGQTGDYNNDGVVNAADYVVWRNNEGTNNALLNDQIGGTIGLAHYNQWRSNFGNGLSGVGSTSQSVVPEPTALLLAWISTCIAACGRMRFQFPQPALCRVRGQRVAYSSFRRPCCHSIDF